MRVRRASVEDAMPIATVHVRSWQVGYRGLLPDTLLDSLEPAQRLPRWTTTLEATSWPERGTLVAADDACGVVGFALLVSSGNDDQDPREVGEIASFYVDPAWWGRGIGRRLMAAAVSELAACYQVGSLWVLDANARAIGFYEAVGWRADGAVKDEVLAGATVRDLRYVKDLPAPR